MKPSRAVFLSVCLAATPGLAATFTVDSTGDEPDAAIDGTCATAGGACTLRAAIDEANSAAGPHTIAFAIPGAGPHTITLGSTLPVITRDEITIDGYTQPGAQANTNSTGPLNSVILVEVSGTGGANDCFWTRASDIVIRGLAIGHCSRGILATSDFTTATGIVIAGNYIGTDASGTAAAPNSSRGVELSAVQAIVGGTDPSDRNLVSGNSEGVVGSTGGSGGFANVAVRGNLIGLDRSGNPLPNFIGLNFYGVGETHGFVGGLTPGAGNEIAWNGKGAQLVQESVRVTIRGNSIHDNDGVGIDLDNQGVTPNDPGDADTGPNGFQNFPIVSSVMPASPAASGGVGTRIQGVLHSAASTTYDLDFYANDPCSRRPQEFLEGKTYLGAAQVTTDGSGDGPFDVTLPVAVDAGSPVSATATDPQGNTSEFSQRLPFSMTPTSGPAAGGTDFAVSGTDLADGATVTIGGVSATNVNVSSSTMLTATSPALAAGTANDLVVTNPDGTAGTLVKGFISDFLDVPFGHPFYPFVTTLVRNAITAGVGGGLYGVNDSTLRQQMAVFLLKAKHGLCYTPPPCQGDFPDVLCPSTFADWIEALADEGITGGCGGGNYCPTNPVLRQQMAVFLLKAKHGSAYVPPPCTAAFDDVPCPSTFADWIEQLAAENITSGCSVMPPLYCPGNANTRGQMAVFIVKTFNLQ